MKVQVHLDVKVHTMMMTLMLLPLQQRTKKAARLPSLASPMNSFLVEILSTSNKFAMLCPFQCFAKISSSMRIKFGKPEQRALTPFY